MNDVNTAGFVIADEDIFQHDTRTGAIDVFFDGSDVGINSDVNAFHLLEDGSVLMSFNTSTVVPDVGPVLPPDVVRFVPTSNGQQTAGTFELYFDGSDVDLTSYYEDVDAIAIAADGSLLLSTAGGYAVGGFAGSDADVLKFISTSLGDDTTGEWELYFDGSDVDLTGTTEDIVGVSVNPVSGQVYFTTQGSVLAGGVRGTGT